MNPEPQPPNSVVITNVHDSKGTMLRVVRLTDDGGLMIEGHDLGGGVEQFFGAHEYEFKKQFSSDVVAQLRDLLGLESDDELLPTIKDRFTYTDDLEEFLRDNGIEGKFWSRVGD
ncbi:MULTISPECIES: hypothetical protein [unclassified Gordonia (in: high G+C Gram-positive bacteria)]|uniref:hypothetical protein n=1 Tax=unclassified Gordonia (in: high G+C Gram-positive bacteria) TaxID=2657482 RepID=UPI0007EB4EFC|nr:MULTISPECIES: hypothetical protein [unclassified Gordonia (in: high G+C Gram-positive bacteria)]OBC06799.1 hypothetical protein A5785_09280 [Gordonia sp. 852002-50395_SCH5434458]OBC13941.1 hypothetical protein A5788_18825 [Gordonia sp. 852002-50816_SCH5313054-c]OBC18676.1 hypothetical protein A5786_01870 [Gordonia sp. 852002-50816_SCH5313054-a]